MPKGVANAQKIVATSDQNRSLDLRTFPVSGSNGGGKGVGVGQLTSRWARDAPSHSLETPNGRSRVGRRLEPRGQISVLLWCYSVLNGGRLVE